MILHTTQGYIQEGTRACSNMHTALCATVTVPSCGDTAFTQSNTTPL